MFEEIEAEIELLNHFGGWYDSSKTLKRVIEVVRGRWSMFSKEIWNPLDCCMMVWRGKQNQPRFLKQLNLLLEAGVPISKRTINDCQVFTAYKLLIHHGAECSFYKEKLPAPICIGGEWMSWILDHCSTSSRLDYANFLKMCEEYCYFILHKEKTPEKYPHRKNPLAGLVVMFHRIPHHDIEINEKLITILFKIWNAQPQYNDLPDAISKLVKANILQIATVDPYHPIIDPDGHAKHFDIVNSGHVPEHGFVRPISPPRTTQIINLIKEYQARHQSFVDALLEKDQCTL